MMDIGKFIMLQTILLMSVMTAFFILNGVMSDSSRREMRDDVIQACFSSSVLPD